MERGLGRAARSAILQKIFAVKPRFPVSLCYFVNRESISEMVNSKGVMLLLFSGEEHKWH